ncbi:hypothetical protein D3C73_959620 [compost metagenome]
MKLSLLAGTDQLKLYCGTFTNPGALITGSIVGAPITATIADPDHGPQPAPLQAATR